MVLEAEGRLVELGRQSHQELIQVYRAQHNSLDLFGNPTWPFEKDTVAVTIFDGVPIFGTNSTTHLYTLEDERAADAARDIAIAQNPELPRGRDRTQIPNVGFYHAEATALLRTARANGGSLEGRGRNSRRQQDV